MSLTLEGVVVLYELMRVEKEVEKEGEGEELRGEVKND